MNFITTSKLATLNFSKRLLSELLQQDTDKNFKRIWKLQYQIRDIEDKVAYNKAYYLPVITFRKIEIQTEVGDYIWFDGANHFLFKKRVNKLFKITKKEMFYISLSRLDKVSDKYYF